MPIFKILRSLSIRTKLLLMVLIMSLPALGMIVWFGFELRDEKISEAEHEFSLLLHSLAAQQEQITFGTKQMLSALSLMPGVKRLDSYECSRIFREL